MRLYIVGTSGSGKSTLADTLAKQYQCKHFDIDTYRFHENWVAKPASQFRQEIMTDIGRHEQWVCCGNYRIILARLNHKIDYIIWLDYPLRIIFWRVLRRTLSRLFSQDQVCGNNYESWRLQFFSKKSIFLWVAKTFCKNKKRYQSLQNKPYYAHKIIHVKHPRHLEQALQIICAKPLAN